jgi:lysylphosphatidylglycerol synthetase-like protein (DUF2156 family)
MYQKTRIILDWVIAITIYTLTLLVIPISNKLFTQLNVTPAAPFLNSIINAVITAVFIGLLIFLILEGSKSTLSSYIWLVILFIISIYFLMRVGFTKDRLHFLGYGILSLFLYRAIRHNIIWSCLIIMFFAILDETLQLFGLGGRTFEIKDIGIDWLSGLVGQFIVALVIKPKLETVDIKIRGYIKNLKKIQIFKSARRPR